MSQYLILIYDNEAEYEANSEARFPEIMRGHEAFQAEFAQQIVGGNALQPTGTATTVRPDGASGHTVTDGPFVETKEALGGYYLVEAPDLDAAIAMAKKIPTVDGGCEVRPIMVFE